ncbi:MAG: DUF4340 domain-containing protein [Gammaproteobacteria bacterium]|nr:DUF4340 domain-containing protein [Gammaproteobacteria bacterium]MDH5802965.1 DUF4340 domain-containing protein [Gammaproteobacteria bacterium]
MKKNQLIILSVITLVAAIAALVANNMKSNAVSNKAAGKALFPALSANVNKVQEVEITKGKNIINIQRKDNTWQVVQKDGYTANLSKIKETILKLAEFKTLEAKTKKQDNFGKLNVEDPTVDSAKSILVTLKGENNTTMAALVVGKQLSGSVTAVGGEKTYVRKMGEDQVWLVAGGLLIDDLAIDWMDEQIMDIPDSRISKIVITPPKGKPVTIVKNKPEDKEFMLMDLPKNKELKSTGELTQTARLLQGLRMKDVSKAEKVDMSTNPNTKTDIYTFDGLVISAVSMQKDSDHFITLDARFDATTRFTPPQDPAPKQIPAPDGKAQPDSTATSPSTASSPGTMLKPAAEVQTEASALSEKLKPWTYTLSKSKGVAFIKTMDDLLKAKE